MRWLAPLLALALVPVAHAGTPGQPDVSDPAGDQGPWPAALDLRAVWLDAGNRSLSDNGRGLVDVTLQVAALQPTDVGTYRVTWTAASALDPGKATSQRGVDLHLDPTGATWDGLLLKDGAWTAVVSGQPAVVDRAAGTLRAVGVTSGGGTLPSLTGFQAESRLAAQAPVADSAAAAGPYVKSRAVEVVPGLPAPARAYDLPPYASFGTVALRGAWVDRTPTGFTVTYDLDRLDAAGIAACDWWRVGFFQGETDHYSLDVYALDSLALHNGTVDFAFLGGTLERQVPGGGPGHTVGNYTSHIALAYGAPGRIRLTLQGAAWNATLDPARLYTSAMVFCEQEQDHALRAVGKSEAKADPASASPASVLHDWSFWAPLGLMVVSLVARLGSLVGRRKEK